MTDIKKLTAEIREKHKEAAEAKKHGHTFHWFGYHKLLYNSIEPLLEHIEELEVEKETYIKLVDYDTKAILELSDKLEEAEKILRDIAENYLTDVGVEEVAQEYFKHKKKDDD